MNEKKEVKIPIKRLREIAEYYEFPLAVFFGGRLKGKRSVKFSFGKGKRKVTFYRR